MPEGAPLVARTLPGVRAVPAAAWDALLHPLDAPSLRWPWLDALEGSGAAGPESDWRPAHVGLFAGERLVGAVPHYVRAGAYGEFVWSGPIEAACAAGGLPFGPRGVATVPFTPIPGRRFLTAPDVDRAGTVALLADALVARMRADGLASLNVHFCADDEVELLRRRGWIVRHQGQDRFLRREGEATFHDVLARFRAKDRNQIRRERRGVREQGLVVRAVPGADAPDRYWDAMGRFYVANAARHGDGPPLLTPAFFARLADGAGRHDVVFFAAEDGAGRLRGLALDLLGADALFGRCWGLAEPTRYLHFECAYYAGIEHAVERGLARFEPGHGGEFKLQRGCEPTAVASLHRFADPGLHEGVSRWAARERELVERLFRERQAALPFRRDGTFTPRGTPGR